MYTKNGTFIGLETSAWYTRFSNSIIPITIAIPTKLSIKNLDGYAVTKGSTNVDWFSTMV
jgi:outer membrane receptor for ferrienterochelin and colicins